MASALKDSCSICKRQHLESTAEQWCPKCDEFLCSSCINHHKSANISKDHKTVIIIIAEDLRAILLDINTNCGIHNEKLEYICSKHDTPFCVRCTPDHRQCGHFSSLRDFEGSEESSIIIELNQSFSNLKAKLNQLKSNKTENLKAIKCQFRNCKKQINDIKVKSKMNIDEEKSKILKELEILYEKSQCNLNEMINTFEKYEKEVEKLQKDFDLMKMNASDIQLYLGVKKYLKELKLVRDSVKQIENSDKNKEIKMVFAFDPICIDAAEVKSFGEVKGTSEMLSRTQKNKQAQLPVSIDNIEGISLKKRIDLDFTGVVGESYIFGCCYADDGSILLTNYSYCRVIVLGQDGSFSREIKLNYKPNKVVFANGGIYVSSKPGKTLAWIEFATGKIIKTKTFEHECDALTLANDRLILNFVDNEYRIFDLHLEYVGFIPIRKRRACHLSYLNGKIYLTDIRDISISCHEMTGQMLWKVRDEHLPRISGCSVDSHGYVFVASYTENNIIVISPDGLNWKIVAHLEHLIRATALYFDRRRGRLLVISDVSPRIQEYDVQY